MPAGVLGWDKIAVGEREVKKGRSVGSIGDAQRGGRKAATGMMFSYRAGDET